MTKNMTGVSRTTVVGLIELTAPVGQVLGALTDATTLPRWAPGFADVVTHRDGPRWQVTKDDHTIDLRIDSDQAVGTVDFVRESPIGDVVGVRLRVTARPGGGTVVTMTLPISPGTSLPDAQELVDSELVALRAVVVS